MEPVRVMHILRVSEGGVAGVVDQLVAGLDRRKFKPYVYLAKKPSTGSYLTQPPSDVETIGIKKSSGAYAGKKPPPPVSGINIHGWLENYLGVGAGSIYIFFKSAVVFIMNQLPEIFLFKRLIKKYGINLIHTHSDVNLNKPEIVAARLSGIPSVCHIHAYTRLNGFDYIFNPLVDHFIYISRDIERFHRKKGKPLEKGRVIHNGIDPDRFKPLKAVGGIDQKEKTVSKVIRIGIVGRLDWWKGHVFFIKALPPILDQFPNVEALIVGTVSKGGTYNRNQMYKTSLEELVVSLGLEDNVIFTGHRDDIPDIIADLDILVHASSRPEPFGLVIIEGMACAIPVVATNAGGVPEIIQDNENGILVPCEDSQAISRAVIDLLANKDRAARIAASGRKTVVEKFTNDIQTIQVENLYHDALKNSLSD